MGSTANKAEFLGLPDGHGIVLRSILLVSRHVPHAVPNFAREITAVGIQRRVVQRFRTVWIWLAHYHMGIGQVRGEHGGRRKDRLGMHGEVVCLSTVRLYGVLRIGLIRSGRIR